MTLRNLIFFLLTLFYFSACTNLVSNRDSIGSKNQTIKNKRNSRVIKFEYGGYGDTVDALIYGNVYELDTTRISNDTLLPLSNVLIKVEENNKTVLTDTGGQFAIGFEKGNFSLLISKQGYQTLLLTNYVSDPDQVSNTIIVLEKGKDTARFEIPKWIK